jgi:hypothetical protein
LIRVISYLIGLFTAVYALVATLAFLWGLLRFLIAVPSAIRQDMEQRRRRRRVVEEPRSPRHVANDALPALPASRPALPPTRDSDVSGPTGTI